MKSLIAEHGGKVAASFTKSVTHLITSPDSVAASTDKVSSARVAGVPVLSIDFVHESIKKGKLQPTGGKFNLDDVSTKGTRF